MPTEALSESDNGRCCMCGFGRSNKYKTLTFDAGKSSWICDTCPQLRVPTDAHDKSNMVVKCFLCRANPSRLRENFWYNAHESDWICQVCSQNSTSTGGNGTLDDAFRCYECGGKLSQARSQFSYDSGRNAWRCNLCFQQLSPRTQGEEKDASQRGGNAGGDDHSDFGGVAVRGRSTTEHSGSDLLYSNNDLQVRAPGVEGQARKRDRTKKSDSGRTCFRCRTPDAHNDTWYKRDGEDACYRCHSSSRRNKYKCHICGGKDSSNWYGRGDMHKTCVKCYVEKKRGKGVTGSIRGGSGGDDPESGTVKVDSNALNAVATGRRRLGYPSEEANTYAIDALPSTTSEPHSSPWTAILLLRKRWKVGWTGSLPQP